MRLRIFPRLLPAPWSWAFRWIVIITVLVLYGGTAIHWFFDGPGHRIVEALPYLKLVFIIVVAGFGGGFRLVRKGVRRMQGASDGGSAAGQAD